MSTSLNLSHSILVLGCLLIVGCAILGESYEPLTHSASLRNVGQQQVFDAVLYFGPGVYRKGILPPGIAKHTYRTGESIPDYARAEWRRADGSVHSGRVRVDEPTEVSEGVIRYVLQIDDDNKLSLKIEFPKPIP